jgi:hypothetical protein
MKVRILFDSWQIENTAMKIPKLFLVIMLITSGCASVQRAFPIPTVWEPAKPWTIGYLTTLRLCPQLFPLWQETWGSPPLKVP